MQSALTTNRILDRRREALPHGRRRYSLLTPEAISRFVYDRCSPYISTINLGISRPQLQLDESGASQAMAKQSKTSVAVILDQCDRGSFRRFGHLKDEIVSQSLIPLFVENTQSLICPLPPERRRKNETYVFLKP